MKMLDVPQSGSVAGVTSSRNRFGQYRRTRAMPTQPQTAAQVTVRGHLTNLAQYWRTMTEGSRLGWNDYAAQHPRTDKLGQSQVLSGFQAFVGYNALNLLLGLAISDNPAVPTAEPANPVTGLTLTATTFQLTGEALAEVPADWYLVVEASPMKSAGVTFNKDYRVVTIGQPEALLPVDAKTNYQAKFGALLQGSRIFVRAYLAMAGQKGVPVEFSQIVQAP